MKKLVLALTAAAALGACSQLARERVSDQLANELHTNPVLTVRSGFISVAPEPIVVSMKELGRGPNAKPMTWRLPAGHRFAAENGIEILGVVVDGQGNPVKPDPKVFKDPNPRISREGRAALSCQINDKDRSEFSCRFTDKAVVGIYRYNIRAVDPSGKPVESDPSIFGME
ncbi:MAG: hypothetical protein JNJ89_00755 [Rubrivivax sp.]|nr:hypothetical protein [Rubrivivax sp.]